MEIRDRFKLVRTALGLSQAEMGEKLSLERSAVSLIERKQRNLTERSIRDLCRELNVDYMWLTEGAGEMFANGEIDYTSKIDQIMAGENEFAKATFKIFARFEDEDWKALQRLIRKYLEIEKETPSF